MSVLGEYLQNLIQASPLWQQGATFVVACSGGPDSLTLAHCLKKLSSTFQVRLKVVHVQHHLRGKAAEADAELVKAFCAKEELEFVRVDVDVEGLVAQEGLSLEEAARFLRHEALEQKRQEFQASAIFLGQHQDDQAETVLLNLLRGAGTRGLRGMQEVNGYLARPFLTVPKEELVHYCAEEKLLYATDSTNDDITFMRNWVRKQLLPLLFAKNPRINKQLAQAAALASVDEDCLEKEAELYLKVYGKRQGESYAAHVGTAFLQLHPAVQTRVLRLVLKAAGAKEVSFAHIKALLKIIIEGKGPKALDVPGKVRANYNKERLMVGKNNVPREAQRQVKNEQKERQRNACKSGENLNR